MNRNVKVIIGFTLLALFLSGLIALAVRCFIVGEISFGILLLIPMVFLIFFSILAVVAPDKFLKLAGTKKVKSKGLDIQSSSENSTIDIKKNYKVDDLEFDEINDILDEE